MNKSMVRCWRIENWYGNPSPDQLYISYPEGNFGHDLISCLNCGHIYAASVSRQVYGGPELATKLESVRCVQCGELLSRTSSPYPEKYLRNGQVVAFHRPSEIPPDDESTIVELDEIYTEAKRESS